MGAIYTGFILFLYLIVAAVLGSYSTMLIHRARSGEWGGFFARSECPKCNQTLGARHLVPIFSFLFLRGKCGYCHAKIGYRYLITELLMTGIVGYGSWLLTHQLFALGEVSLSSWIGLLFVAIPLFCLTTVAIYDALYGEIPDFILLPCIGFILIILCFDTFLPDRLFSNAFSGSVSPLSDGLIGAAFFYVFFAIQMLIPGIRELLVEKKESKSTAKFVGDVLLFPIWLVISALFGSRIGDKLLPNLLEEKKYPQVWVGGGDVRMGIVIGLIGGWKIALLTVLMGYVAASFIGVPYALRKKQASLPLGPFLLIGFLCALVFGDFFL